ncbi:S1C family serine protease [Aquibacillus salsiterrae]|uniref:Trypsin-like peptidase domain-containing protein n=1 Tax=Aquibacillus salsiterrae TaxID=2950439 RepID=A0A9X4AEQ1_9BACI|nr:trypsin-like peptidase domain-containing protein [Aquibacillus salsiterrae]MDC3417056.1 trypsin-like peptidase domain-containing protein [Aquibacillus salsiterrae]
MSFHDNHNNDDKQHDLHEFEDNRFEPSSKQTGIIQNDQMESNKEMRSKQKSSNKLAMFMSGITGGIVVAIIGVLLIFTGAIPTPQSETISTANSDVKSVTDTKTSDSNIIPTIAQENGNSGALTTTLEKVSDAVVGIANIQQAGLWSQSQEAGTGSGVIYKKENGKAYVVTNNHVVDGASEVEVILTNGDRVDAKVLGADQLSDLAVLEMDGSKVTQVATLGSSSNLAVGDPAIAIGNPLGTEFAGTVTKGIISGVERSVDIDLNKDGQPDWTTEVIQTDAAINPGNSGGALINSAGEVIGINSMKIAQESVEGIGFSIPIDTAKPIIDQLETTGEVARPFMGISAVALSTVPDQAKVETLNLPNDVTKGVVVAQVEQRSPADAAGLERYDVITKINDTDISSMIDVRQVLYSETKIGDQIDITYYRDGKKQTTTLTLSQQS